MGLYVIGMHRSGTSALTGLLAKLLDLELESGAVESNPLGQWELTRMRPALDLLLLANRSTWSHPLGDQAQLRIPKLVDRVARRSFARECREPFIWKDPRLCLTLDYWLGLDQEAANIVFIHRDPFEVADSLTVRNGWSTERGLALWERTNRNAIIRLAGRQIVCVSHSDLMAAPSRFATDLASWMRLSPNSESIDAAAATIRPKPPASPPAERPLTSAMLVLADYLADQKGPVVLSLQGLGPESPSTSEHLTPASLPLLGRQLYRSLRQMVS